METKPHVEKIIINNKPSFEAWSRSVYRFRRRNAANVCVFDLPEFSFRENIELSTYVDQYSKANGSKGKSTAIAVAFLSTIIKFFSSGTHFSEITGYQLLSGIGLILLAGITGKIIDRTHARWKLFIVAHRIQKKMNGEEADPVGAYFNNFITSSSFTSEKSV